MLWLLLIIRGRPALSASFLGAEILALGIEPLVHFTCKDKNRNQIESELYALDRAGVQNLLVMSGDYPTGGFKGQAKPVSTWTRSTFWR